MRTVIAIALLLMLVVPCGAVQLRSDEATADVPSGTQIGEDLAIAGNTVQIAGNVRGDVLAAGSTVTVTGSVAQSLLAAAGTLSASGPVGNDTYLCGGTVNLSGTVRDNAWLAGGTVSLLPGATVGSDLLAAAGTLNVDGRVSGDLYANAGTVTLGPQAVVTGNVYTTVKPRVSPGARIGGRVIVKPAPQRPERRPPSPVAKFFTWLLTLAMLYAVGAVLLALAPRMVSDIGGTLLARPWWSLLIGFLILLAMPAVILVLMLTIIGIPLGLIVLALYLVVLYISRIFAAVALGRLVVGQRSSYLTLLVGLAIIWVVGVIPVIGWIVNFAALLFGLGAFAYHRYTLTRELRGTGRI
ncbi:MAG: bactofilin family protein [Armatimonadota bacterium]